MMRPVNTISADSARVSTSSSLILYRLLRLHKPGPKTDTAHARKRWDRIGHKRTYVRTSDGNFYGIHIICSNIFEVYRTFKFTHFTRNKNKNNVSLIIILPGSIKHKSQSWKAFCLKRMIDLNG